MSATLIYTITGGTVLILCVFLVIFLMKKRSAGNFRRELSTEIENQLGSAVEEPPRPEPEKTVKGELDVIIKNKKVSTTRIFSEELKIGRDPSVADLVIGEPTVSKLHCTLFVQPDRLRVRDNHSTNGTFVNEQRIDERDLSDDATISLGRRGTVRLIFRRSTTQ